MIATAPMPGEPLLLRAASGMESAALLPTALAAGARLIREVPEGLIILAPDPAALEALAAQAGLRLLPVTALGCDPNPSLRPGDRP